MKYLLLSQDEKYAKELAAAMWLLTRPSGNDSTKYYVDWHVHADGRVALCVYDETQPIHPDCDSAAFCKVISDSVTDQELAVIESSIDASKGEHMSFLDVCLNIPSLSNNLRTTAQMEADGWFPTDVTP
jgi:hypothetical protein